MRITRLAARLIALMALSLVASGSVLAFGRAHYDRNSTSDPYAYKYEHRGYYPYYGSRYWRPAHKVRRRRFNYTHPRYHKAWGLYRDHIQREHHGHPHGTVRPHTHRHHFW